MRTISTEKLAQARRSGNLVRMTKPVKKKAPQKPAPSTSKPVVKDNSAELILKSTKGVAELLLKTTEKLKDVSTCGKVKQWNITVVRGKNKLIKTLKLKAVK